jgi:hypothetical protein
LSQQLATIASLTGQYVEADAREGRHAENAAMKERLEGDCIVDAFATE